MGLRDFKLPICDQCGAPWLPDEGPARDDIRAYDAAERAKGKTGKPVRCGKCKSTRWDENWRKSSKTTEKVELAPEIVPPVTREDLVTVLGDEFHLANVPGFAEGTLLPTESLKSVPQLCRHRVIDCPICAGQKK